jgi:flagellar biosynthesis/type III secretory pathway protein FliH
VRSRVQLEVFHLATSTPASDIVVLGKVELEETRLAAFDKGYAAGWDDATVATQTDRSKAEDEVWRNLQALGFTFQEARMHLLQGLKPLLTTMMSRLLPALGRELLNEHILAALLPYAETTLEKPIRLHVNPRSVHFVDRVTSRANGLDLRITEDAALSEGQVFLRFENGDETQINLDRAVQQIMTVVTTFFDYPQENRKHG